jgi:hypothetical protein
MQASMSLCRHGATRRFVATYVPRDPARGMRGNDRCVALFNDPILPHQIGSQLLEQGKVICSPVQRSDPAF